MSANNNSTTIYRSLEGKTALVTGSSRGIGAGIAEHLASKGAKLILNYTAPSSFNACSDVASKLTEKYGVEHVIVQADLSTVTGPAQLIETAASKIPGLKLDIIVNNAGVLIMQNLPDCTVEAFEKQYMVNVRGPLLLIKAALPYLPNDRSGRIVNVSSMASTVGAEGQTIYGGTKAALDAMTRTWARELAERATVNSINPGPVLTDMLLNGIGPVPESHKVYFSMGCLQKLREGVDTEEMIKYASQVGGRPAYIHEVAGIVGMLVSSDSGWCTGQVVCANGGWRLAT